jgi:hypothetical protein
MMQWTTKQGHSEQESDVVLIFHLRILLEVFPSIPKTGTEQPLPKEREYSYI